MPKHRAVCCLKSETLGLATRAPIVGAGRGCIVEGAWGGRIFGNGDVTYGTRVSFFPVPLCGREQDRRVLRAAVGVSVQSVTLSNGRRES